MKLINTIRDAFVRAAIDDVPTVDYVEQIRKIALDAAVEALPPKIKTIYKDKTLVGFLNTTTMSIPGIYTSVAVPSAEHWTSVAMPKSVADQVAELVAAHKTQSKTVSDLTAKLKQAAYACTTRKQLADLLPEFQKYLPADHAQATRSVPVITNVVADFVKAGWPKGGK